MSTIYDHLLTCSCRPVSTENLVKKMEETWDRANILNTPPVLSGPSPSITNPQIAFLLASLPDFQDRFLRPEMRRAFNLAIAEAKSSLVSHCRTHPTVEKIRANSLRAAVVDLVGRARFLGEPEEDYEEYNDADAPL